MKPQTQKHLDAADRHRDFSYSQHPLSGHDGWREWAIIGAFYGAVHYVNAYLGETYDFAPANHRDRTIAVYRDAALAAVAACYDLLRDSAYAARYHPTFRASNALHQETMRCLEQIRSVVLAEFDR